MYELIIDSIKTREDKEKLVDEIRRLKDAIYQDNGRFFESILKSKVRYWIAGLIKDEIQKTKLDREYYLENLLLKLKDVKEVNLVIAFEPTQDFVDRVGDQLKTVVGDSVILNISYDPSIIGGAQIIFEGVYRDYSFKKVFEREFANFEAQMIQILEKNTNLQ